MGLTVMLLGNKLEDTQPPFSGLCVLCSKQPKFFLSHSSDITGITTGLPAVPSAFNA